MSDERIQGEQSDRRRRPLLRRADQAAAMTVVVAALLAMLGSWLVRGGRSGGVIDLDTAPRREARFRVDINRADWPELALLPHVGRVLARRIVESRERDGPFADHNELLRVKGIGPKTLARIKPYLLPIPDVEDIADK